MPEKLEVFMISVLSQCSVHPLGIAMSLGLMIISNPYWIIKLSQITDLNNGGQNFLSMWVLN